MKAPVMKRLLPLALAVCLTCGSSMSTFAAETKTTEAAQTEEQTAGEVAAQENDALIADVGRRFYECSDPQALYATDGVHPSELGSHIAAETIAAVIQQHEKEAQ